MMCSEMLQCHISVMKHPDQPSPIRSIEMSECTDQVVQLKAKAFDIQQVMAAHQQAFTKLSEELQAVGRELQALQNPPVPSDVPATA